MRLNIFQKIFLRCLRCSAGCGYAIFTFKTCHFILLIYAHSKIACKRDGSRFSAFLVLRADFSEGTTFSNFLTFLFFELSSSPVRDSSNNLGNELRRFPQLYGFLPEISSSPWRRIAPSLPANALPSHLLWALRWLKIDAPEGVNADAEGCTEKPFCKWSSKRIRYI